MSDRDLTTRRSRRFEGLPPGPVVKICGLTRVEDVLLACDLGAWAVGFVFAPSPRRLTPAAARGLISAAVERLRGAAAACKTPADGGPGTDTSAARGVKPGAPGGPMPGVPLTVGVFGDAPADEIAGVVEEVGLDGVQLHGREGPAGNAVRAALAGREHPPLVIKAVPVAPGETDASGLKEAVARAREEADLVLLDTGAAGWFGGTGSAFPWLLAREAAKGCPLLVAGGIGPQNVGAALAQSGAWGVDVSSGVERSPGVKDPQLMLQLFSRVKEGPDR
jgi:phosphoribosylanthranilate isomerase